jgi:hypothetical protein
MVVGLPPSKTTVVGMGQEMYVPYHQRVYTISGWVTGAAGPPAHTAETLVVPPYGEAGKPELLYKPHPVASRVVGDGRQVFKSWA